MRNATAVGAASGRMHLRLADYRAEQRGYGDGEACRPERSLRSHVRVEGRRLDLASYCLD